MSDLGGAVDLGVKLGNVGVDAMLKYTRHEYEEKISELEGYNTRLNQHLERLEGFKTQIPGFWDDAKAAKTIEALNASIARVKHASERTSNLRKSYQKVVEEMAQQDQQVDSALDKAIDLLKGLDIV